MHEHGIGGGRWSPKIPDKYVEQAVNEEENPWDDYDDDLRVQRNTTSDANRNSSKDKMA